MTDIVKVHPPTFRSTIYVLKVHVSKQVGTVGNILSFNENLEVKRLNLIINLRCYRNSPFM